MAISRSSKSDSRSIVQEESRGSSSVEAKRIVVSFGDRRVLNGLSFIATAGKVNTLIGRNGSGKSTLLRVLAGIVKPDAGSVNYNGLDITALNRRKHLLEGIVYLKQTDHVYAELSVSDNLKAASHAAVKTAKYAEMLEKVLALLPDMKPLAARKAGLLSVGEKQQLALGMCLIQCPRVLLLDEPTANLSPQLAKEVCQQVSEITIALGLTTIWAEQIFHHDYFSMTNLLINGIITPYSVKIPSPTNINIEE